MGGVLVASFAAVATTCLQIDSAPKVADYYDQYRDYRDQYNRLMEWKDRIDASSLLELLPEGLQDSITLVKNRSQIAESIYADIASGLPTTPGGYGVVAVRQVGPLTRPYWPEEATGGSVVKNDPQLCFQLDMGAHIGLMAETGRQNTLSRQCDSEGRQALANLSVRPSRDGAGLAPNTAQASEVTRSVMHNEFAMLDVARGDLAWLRDNTQHHTPYRYPRERFDIEVGEAAKHSAGLQRVAGIMAGRGFAAYGYEPVRLQRAGLADTGHAMNAANVLSRLNLAYDGIARYATVYPRLANIRDGLLDVDTNLIDGANEAERYGIGLQLMSMKGVLSMLRLESRQREERLMGGYLAGSNIETGGQP